MNASHPEATETRNPIDVLGPTIEFLTPPLHQDAYCVLRGIIPAGVTVPLHSHPDAESFLVVSGCAQALSERADRLQWIDVRPGDFIHIPGGMKHAHRNPSNEPVVEIVVTTPALGRFFQEVGRPVLAGSPLPPPTSEELQRFERIAAKYRHWLATPAENAAVGIPTASLLGRARRINPL